MLLGGTAARSDAGSMQSECRHFALNDEHLLVALAHHLIDTIYGQLQPAPLKILLQARLGIFEFLRGRDLCQRGRHDVFDCRARGGESAVQVDGAKQCFERVREYRAAAKPAAAELPGAENEMLAQPDPGSDLCERLAPHHTRAQ